MDDPSCLLVVVELFSSTGRERARGKKRERERQTHGSFVHTYKERERERESERDAHATLTTRFVEEGNEERKKERRTQRSAVQREQTYGRTNAVFTSRWDYSTSRSSRVESSAKFRERVNSPFGRASLVRDPVDRLIDRHVRERVVFIVFFFFCSLPSVAERPCVCVCVCVHLSLSFSLSRARALPPPLFRRSLALSLFLSRSFSVAQCAEYNARFTLSSGTEVRVARVPEHEARGVRDRSPVRARRVVDGALVQRALPGHDGVPVGLS